MRKLLTFVFLLSAVVFESTEVSAHPSPVPTIYLKGPVEVVQAAPKEVRVSIVKRVAKPVKKKVKKVQERKALNRSGRDNKCGEVAYYIIKAN